MVIVAVAMICIGLFDWRMVRRNSGTYEKAAYICVWFVFFAYMMLSIPLRSLATPNTIVTFLFGWVDRWFP